MNRPTEISVDRSSFDEFALPVWTPSGLRTIVYGDTDRYSTKPILVCVPGITRNYQDFRDVAEIASQRFRVIGVTLLGMGRSDRLPSAEAYRAAGWDAQVNCVVTLLAHLRAKTVTFLGTSFGGVIGILLAAQPNTPISTLILNDIGAFCCRENFIGFNEALASEIKFLNLAHAEKFIKFAFRSVGYLTAREWHAFTLDSIEAADGDQYRLSYDPNIARQFLGEERGDLDLWDCWNSVRCPTLVVRGKESQWLSESTVEKMRDVNPACDGLTLNGCGHFPHLRSKEHIEPIMRWLEKRMLIDA